MAEEEWPQYQPRDRNPDEPVPGYVRLSVNISKENADFIRALDLDTVTATETVNRALQVWKYIDEEQQRGTTFMIRPKRGPEMDVTFDVR